MAGSGLGRFACAARQPHCAPGLGIDLSISFPCIRSKHVADPFGRSLGALGLAGLRWGMPGRRLRSAGDRRTLAGCLLPNLSAWAHWCAPFTPACRLQPADHPVL